MNILIICAAAIVSAILAVTVRRYSAEQSMLICIGSAALILLSLVRETAENIALISDLFDQSGIRADYILILLKTLGICFLTEFSCDTATQAGMLSLSTAVLSAGKVLVLVTALPLFTEIFSVISQLAG